MQSEKVPRPNKIVTGSHGVQPNPTDRSLYLPVANRRDRALYLGAYTYLAFLTLTLEIISMRGLAPLIGTHILSTSACIGWVLLGLGFGYFLNTRKTDSGSRLGISLGLLVIAVTCFLVPFVLEAFRYFLGVSGSFLTLNWIVKVICTFVVAPALVSGVVSVAIGFCSPSIFEKISKHYPSTRETAAISFLFGGLGSFLGALVPGFLLIPVLGVGKAYFLLGSLTLCVAILLRTRARTRRMGWMACAVIATLLLGWVWSKVRFSPPGLVTRVETAYQEISVQDQVLSMISEDPVRVFYVDTPYGIQSISQETMTYLKSPYYAGMLTPLLRLAREGGRIAEKAHALILGSAGATVSTSAYQLFSRESPGMLKLTNVDIDPAVHQVARDFFSASNPDTEFVGEDARLFVRSTEQTYDHIVVDEFSKGFYIPSEALTVEFFSNLKSITRPGGTVLFNLVAVSEKSRLIQAVAGGLNQFFGHLYVARIVADTAYGLSNYFVVATDQRIDLAAWERSLPAHPFFKVGSKKFMGLLKEIHPNGAYETDDSVSSEYLAFRVFMEAAHPAFR